jgi:hypothetical protein
MGMVRAIGRGLAAGAAGTTALNAVTYLDMALRARPASPMPAKAVDLMSDKADRPIPGEGEDRDNRREGLGALMGIATGLGVGVAAGIAGPILTRLPTMLSGLLVGAGAMAASDLPMASLGLTDPKQWSAPDWAADAAPHAAYGLAVVATLRGLRNSS